MTTIWFSPSAATTISAIPVVPARSSSSSTPAARRPDERLVGERVDADRADHPHVRAEPRRGDGLVRALAAGEALERRAGDRLPGPRQPLDARDEVEVDRPDDGELDSHEASVLRPHSARRSRHTCVTVS